MLTGFEDLEQSNDIGMFDLLQQVNLLEYFPLAKVVLHIVLLDSLDGDLLSRQLVDAEGDLAEGSFSNQLYELVEIQCCRRQLVVLLDVLLDVLNQVVSLLQDSIVHLGRRLRCCRVVAR